ncbi:RNA-binding protein 40-like [Hibiscus syriacus]|uniref:RNA-binding protein 40-like n=1 Tax=Hibiscus syriacus TaxID=106335 RepID=A0A6A2ZEW6_HIBSY|nr:non-structural maintenance of chromosomes element 3 homolog [Hibiscus syriacus]XP_039015624.1 non-structural maintenance of chromosomes element 3 homolog [Hibiscus syriacus]XP_039015625.1 non-structural maintenance of chromosomes element 3 homolog [Hibiscus syriacus]XP_039015626.1 non-structural maintenance of chromosomes element 3 homolog [Hibiscus syriacus]KAE8690408.1 RNA-binding protein 40-like [Hibiscus syriacus]
MENPGECFSQLDISKEEKDKLVAEVIRYILFKTHQNSGRPIKREELSQLVTKNYRHFSLPAYIINQAKEKLSSIFGYELRELQRSRPSSTNQSLLSQQSGIDAKSYVIISQLPADVYKKYVEDVNTSHMNGFTFVVISIVQLAGGKIAEDNLWHHLKRMGLHETDENHPILGNVKQSLEMFVHQRYNAERALEGTVSERIKQYLTQIVKKDDTTGYLVTAWC